VRYVGRLAREEIPRTGVLGSDHGASKVALFSGTGSVQSHDIRYAVRATVCGYGLVVE